MINSWYTSDGFQVQKLHISHELLTRRETLKGTKVASRISGGKQQRTDWSYRNVLQSHREPDPQRPAGSSQVRNPPAPRPSCHGHDWGLPISEAAAGDSRTTLPVLWPVPAEWLPRRLLLSTHWARTQTLETLLSLVEKHQTPLSLC